MLKRHQLVGLVVLTLETAFIFSYVVAVNVFSRNDSSVIVVTATSSASTHDSCKIRLRVVIEIGLKLRIFLRFS